MKVGFIGLGGIGKPMAINIARSGFDLSVTDLRKEPLNDLAGHGATIMATPKEVAESSDIVLASLPSDKSSEQVALAEDGVLNGAKSCLLYTSPSPRDRTRSRMPSSA